jgi:predicted DCC family thiol-disulfide oxidoreductase YuxK
MSLPPNEIGDSPAIGPGPGPGAAGARHVILFDGVCDLCNSGVAWIRARDRDGAFEFLPLQAPEVPRRWPALDPAALARSMHVVAPDGRVRAGIDAAPWIFSRLAGWGWLAALLSLPLVRAVARPLYSFVAARRRSIPRLTSCPKGD